MNTINKQALLDWLNTQFANTPYGAVSAKIKEIYNEIQSGRFDSPSDDRLRAALEQILTVVEDSPVKTYQRMEDIAREALSINTEQSKSGHDTGINQVIDIWDELFTNGNFAGMNALERSLNAVGIAIPGINIPTGPSKSSVGLMLDKEDTNE